MKSTAQSKGLGLPRTLVAFERKGPDFQSLLLPGVLAVDI